MKEQMTMDEQLDRKLKRVGKFITERQFQHSKDHDSKAAYAMACADAAPVFGFQTGDEVKDWYWKTKRELYPSKPSINDNGKDEVADTRGLGPTALYRLWLQKHDSATCDAELAHFTGYTYNAFAYARTKLKDDGWNIQKKDGRWRVLSRPENNELRQKIDTLESELSALTELLAELRSQV